MQKAESRTPASRKGNQGPVSENRESDTLLTQPLLCIRLLALHSSVTCLNCRFYVDQQDTAVARARRLRRRVVGSGDSFGFSRRAVARSFLGMRKAYLPRDRSASRKPCKGTNS